MDPENFRNRRTFKWIAIFGVWTLFALFFTSMFAFQNQLSKEPLPIWRILSWQLVSGYIWFALSPAILFLAKRFPFEEGKWKLSLPIHVVTGILTALVQLALDAFILTRHDHPAGNQC